MGSTYYKKTSCCECGENYGSCEKHNVFVFRYNRTCDIGTLYVKRHIEEENAKYESLGSFGDNDLSALIDVLTSEKKIEDISPEEYKEIDKCW